MKRIYLYQLLKHSKAGFAFAVVFLAGYTIVFLKKMDMTIFPYNSMFAIEFKKELTSKTYAIKVNDELVKTTHFPYWKKDFLESSLRNYAYYLQNGHQLYMHSYLQQNKWPPGIMRERLVPKENAAAKWPSWYVNFAGYKIPSKRKLEIVEYQISYENNKALISDSIIIYRHTNRLYE